jgi:hypothetical protein
MSCNVYFDGRVEDFFRKIKEYSHSVCIIKSPRTFIKVEGFLICGRAQTGAEEIMHDGYTNIYNLICLEHVLALEAYSSGTSLKDTTREPFFSSPASDPDESKPDPDFTFDYYDRVMKWTADDRNSEVAHEAKTSRELIERLRDLKSVLADCNPDSCYIYRRLFEERQRVKKKYFSDQDPTGHEEPLVPYNQENDQTPPHIGFFSKRSSSSGLDDRPGSDHDSDDSEDFNDDENNQDVNSGSIDSSSDDIFQPDDDLPF